MTSVFKIIVLTTSRLVDSFDVLGITGDRTAGMVSMVCSLLPLSREKK